MENTFLKSLELICAMKQTIKQNVCVAFHLNPLTESILGITITDFKKMANGVKNVWRKLWTLGRFGSLSQNKLLGYYLSIKFQEGENSLRNCYLSFRVNNKFNKK